MKILITGIGNIGKSTLREKVANNYPEKLIQIDMDYFEHEEIPQSSEKVILVEDVHGLERNPDQYDKIIYLMPPKNHIFLWIKRAWAWFSGGIVDLSEPKGINNKYMPLNIPIIFKIVLKNIFYRKKWILDDMEKIKTKFKNKTVIAENLDTGLKEIKNCLN
jgi:GTPase SAR1 family protein